jgi:AAA+ ATPase superfamily predicted ATPase
MYFETEPKSRKKDLFNYEEEYSKLKKAIECGDRIIALKGIRRIGKTSLLKVMYSEIKTPKIFIDGRIVEPNINSIFKHIIEGIILGISDAFIDMKARNLVKSLGISVLGMKMELDLERGSRSIQEIDKILKKKKTSMVIVIDEVQKLKLGKIDGIIAHLYEHTKNIQFVLAGSEIGLMDEVLGEESSSDLYGRPKTVIRIERLDNVKCKEFLAKGFSQMKKEVSADVYDLAVENFDGIIGWHTLFGYYALKEDPLTAKDRVVKEGKKIVASEIENFLSNRSSAKKRYLEVLAVLKNPQHWSDVRNYLIAKEKKNINDRMVSKYLNELKKHGFIIKREDRYVIADPMASKAVDYLIARVK